MKFKKGKILKSLALVGSLGVIVSVPIITTSCSNIDENGYMDNLSIKKDAKVFTDFSTLVSGYQDGSDMNQAVGKALSTDTNKSILINGYDSLTDSQKNSLTVSVSGIEKETETGWGSTPYETWKNEDSAQKIIANYGEKFVVSSLKDLHEQLNKEDTLKALLKSAGIDIDASQETSKHDETELEESTNSATVSLIEKNNIGVEKVKNGGADTKAIDLIHISVQVSKTQPSEEESTYSVASTETTTKYDLALPASNIDYKVGSVDVIVQNGAKEIKDKVNVDLKVGISTSPVSDKENKLEFESKKEIKEFTSDNVLDKLQWTKAISKNGASQTKTLDSEKISQSLGMHNVEFTDFNIKETNGKLGDDNYEGYTFELKGTPKNGAVWEDGSTGEKTISIPNVNLVAKDAMISTFSYNEKNPYEVSWDALFNGGSNELLKGEKISLPSLEELKNKFEKENYMEEFQKTLYSIPGYAQDFQSVNLEFVSISEWEKQGKDSETTSEYKLTLKVVAKKGHEFHTNFKWADGKQILLKLKQTGEAPEVVPWPAK